MTTIKDLDDHLAKDAVTGIYSAKFKDRAGKKHCRTLKTTDRDKARSILRESGLLAIEAAAQANSLTAEGLTAIMAGRKVTCADALAEFEEWRVRSAAPNTVRTQVVTLRRFLSDLGADRWPVNKLTFEHCDAFINAPEAGKVGNRAVRLSALKAFFSLLTAKAYYVGNPAQLVRIRYRSLSHEQKEKLVRVPFTQHEVQHILANTQGFWRWATAISYWTGLRLSDIACLEWSSILPGEIVVWTRKSGARVALPLAEPLIGGGQLRSVFFDLIEHQGHGQYVFPEQRDTILDPLKRSKLSVYYSRVLDQIGIKGKSFHCLRHSFCTRLCAAGKTLEEIGRFVGHASPTTTTGYVHK